MNRLLKVYRQKRKIADFFFLTYLDKGLSFALPLGILFIIKDKSLYSYIEVIFSYASIVMVLLEFGLSNFLFYGYKHAAQPDEFIRRSQSYFKCLLTVYFILIVILLASGGLGKNDDLLMISLIGIRSLFMLFTNFYSGVFRLQDHPSAIYKYTVLVNLFSFGIICLSFIADLPFKLFSFFLPPLLLVAALSFRFLFFEIRSFNFSGFFPFVKQALSFSWPIILNVLAMAFIGNYAKIYAFANMPPAEMVQMSYILRMGLLIQLTHSAFSSYFSKTLFMNKSNVLDVVIFKKYSFVLFLSAVLLLLVILASNFVFRELINVPLNLPTAFFMLYIITWCYIGYLEIYFGVLNANRRVFYYSVVSSLFYVALLKFGGEIDLFKLSFFMFLTGIFNLVLVLAGLKKLGVFNFQAVPK